MTVLHTENWSGATPPSPPTGWTFGGSLITTAPGPTPVSGSNLIELPPANSAYSVATWGTADTNSGNVSVVGTGQFGGSSDDGAFSVLGRGSASTLTYGSSSFYEANLDAGTGVAALNKNVSGTPTTLASVSGVTLSGSVWYQTSLFLSAATQAVIFQRLSDGYYLTSAGAWQSASAVALSATDSSISGAGYAGWSASTGNIHCTAYGSVWTLSTYSPAITAAIAATGGGDSLAASGGFVSPASLSPASGPDVMAAAGKFTSPASLAHATAPDTLAAAAGFKSPAALAVSSAGDVLAASGAFTATSTMAAAGGGDVGALVSLDTHATANSAAGGDSFAGSGAFHGAFTMGAVASGDTMAAWTSVNPRLQATEHHDTFAASADGRHQSSGLACRYGRGGFGSVRRWFHIRRSVRSPGERGKRPILGDRHRNQLGDDGGGGRGRSVRRGGHGDGDRGHGGDRGGRPV